MVSAVKAGAYVMDWAEVKPTFVDFHTGLAELNHTTSFPESRWQGPYKQEHF